MARKKSTLKGRNVKQDQDHKGRLPPEDQLGKEKRRRREIGQREESTCILAILYRTKYINNNYPLAGELRIPCTLSDTLLVHALQR